MTIPRDNVTGPYVEAASKTWEVFLNGAKEWADIVPWIATFSFGKEVPNAVELVDRTFDRAEQIFALQRKVARGVAEAYAPITEKATLAWSEALGRFAGSGPMTETAETKEAAAAS
jgi:hypothetical protein